MKYEAMEQLMNQYLFAWGFYQGARRPWRLLTGKRQWMRENGLECWPKEGS